MKSTVEDLILLLLYMTRLEKDYDKLNCKVCYAGKQYPDYMLELLNAYGYIKYDTNAESVMLTDLGIKKAVALKKQYLEGQ